MTKLPRKLGAVLATGALLLNLVTGPALATTIEISGNGSDTSNAATVNMTTSTTVVQSNTANVTNNVSTSAESGGNTASGNTGGDVSIKTGDAETEANVANALNKNSANVNCCPSGNTDVLISGNGTNSKNQVNLDQDSSISVFQNNNAKVVNNVDADATTGDNKANDNTGGNVKIKTGDASTKVDVATMANSNSANIGDGNGGSVSLRIVGNGSKSQNLIDLDLMRDITVVQDNRANVLNNVDADADTGDNKANDNTGGDVSIKTGDADTKVEVDNMVNFNHANVDCGCLVGIMAKIGGNGTDSKNLIKAELLDNQSIFQDNVCGAFDWWWDWEGDWWFRKQQCANNVQGDADTGDNKAKDNTGPVSGDATEIKTGDASSDVSVGTSGNVNHIGPMPGFDWPNLPDLPGLDLGFNVNLGWLLVWLGLSA